MNSTIIPVRLVSGTAGACPVHPPSRHATRDRRNSPDPVATLAGSRQCSSADGGPVVCWIQAHDARPGADAGQQLGGLGRAFLLVGVAALRIREARARLASASVAQPTQAGRSTPLRACPVSGQVSARALMASSAARIVRRVPRAGGCSGSPAAGRPRTFRHTHGSVRLDADGPLTRVAHRLGADVQTVARTCSRKLPTAAATFGIWSNVGNQWAVEHPDTAANAVRNNEAKSSP
jgi:hypothetical protein